MRCPLTTHRDIVDFNLRDTDNLRDFDDIAYGDVDLFNLMDELTDNGHEDIVDCFKTTSLNFTRLLCLT